MRKRIVGILLGILLLPAAAAHAQVAWDSPYFVPPGATPGLGLYLVDVEGGGVGVTLTWRPRTAAYGLRAGIADAPAGDIGIYGGIDFEGNITQASASMPLDIDWVFGAGLGVADWTRLSIPLGLSLGHTFRDPSATFKPYITPRIFLDAAFGNGDSEADLGFAVDLGLDLTFTRGFLVRFGASLGDRDAVGVGLVF
jgi:hypothetical protein